MNKGGAHAASVKRVCIKAVISLPASLDTDLPSWEGMNRTHRSHASCLHTQSHNPRKIDSRVVNFRGYFIPSGSLMSHKRHISESVVRWGLQLLILTLYLILVSTRLQCSHKMFPEDKIKSTD